MQLAEQFYRYGLEVADRKATLFSNYAVLKESEGDIETAQQLYQALISLNERDPYLWYSLGKTAAQNSHYPDAINYFEKAIEQAPYLHQLQFELAVVYFKNEQFSLARQALAKAVELSPVNGKQQRYNAKLAALALYP